MTFNAIIDVANALLKMFCAKAAGLMLMAGEARVSAEDTLRMAGRARCLVRTDQREEAVVVEVCRLPAVLAMTCRAVRRPVGMKCICRWYVTAGALAPRGFIQKGV